jgi:hypothetical protein
MSLILDGTNGVSDIDGTAATPAIRGTDTNTGIFFPAADTIAFSEGGTEAMRIDGSGNVGIGVVPAAWQSGTSVLQVGTRSAIWQGTGGGTNISNNQYNTAVPVSTYLVTGAATQYNQSAAGDHIWSNAPSGTAGTAISFNERMRITSNGNLLVGTTSDAALDRVHISQAVSGRWGSRYSVVDQASVTIFSAGTGGIAHYFVTVATFVGAINCSASATSYTSASDYRLKKDVKPLTGALADVAKLKPVTFTFKNSGESSLGFIAHELQEVIPQAVTGNKNEVDAEGREKYQGVDTSFLVATLTAAIQELKATVDAQAARIAALEAAV